MSQNRKRQRPDEEKDGDNYNHSVGGHSEWSFNFEEENNTIGNNSNVNEFRELKLKMATLEAKNQMLESKLENLELKARLQTMTEESGLVKLKEENKAIRDKMEAAEKKFNEAVQSIKTMQQKMDESAMEMTLLKEEYNKKVQNLEERNEVLGTMVKGVEPKGQMEIKELSQKMEKSEVKLVKKLTSLEKKQENKSDKMKEFNRKLISLEKLHRKEMAEINTNRQEENNEFNMLKNAQEKVQKTIQINMYRIGEFSKQMTSLSKQQMETIKWGQLKTDALWGHLIKGKRLVKIKRARWDETKTNAKISENGLIATSNTDKGGCQYVFAKKGFRIYEENLRKDNFPGTILYYFEVCQISSSKWSVN